MSARWEMRLDPVTERRFADLCRARRCDRADLVRTLLREEEARTRPPEENCGLAKVTDRVPFTPESMHRWLNLPEPTETQLTFYRRFPRNQRGVLEGSPEMEMAAWVAALSHVMGVVIITPNRRGLEWLRARWRIPAGLVDLFERQAAGVLWTSSVPADQPRAWVTAGMPSDGNYPRWFLDALEAHHG